LAEISDRRRVVGDSKLKKRLRLRRGLLQLLLSLKSLEGLKLLEALESARVKGNAGQVGR